MAKSRKPLRIRPISAAPFSRGFAFESSNFLANSNPKILSFLFILSSEAEPQTDEM